MLDYQYILQCKRNLDRIGRAKTVNLGEAKPTKYFINQVKQLRNAIPKLDAINTNVNNIIGSISAGSTEIQAGLGTILSFQKSFKEPLSDLMKSVTAFENLNAELNESFGMGSVAAANLAQQLRNMPDLGVGDEKLFAFAKSINEVVGGMFKYNDATERAVSIQKILTTNMGLTADQAESYQLFLQGGTEDAEALLLKQRAISKEIGTATGIDALRVQSSLTKEIAGLTNDIQLQYSRIPGSLELAVLKSKALGISVEQLNRTGESLLDIQGSIGKEIEYQALTGRQLTVDGNKSLTDEYRKATIMGDASRQAELMNQFIESEGEGLRTNLLARKKAAELLGTDEGTIAKMIQKRTALQKLGAEDLMNLKGDEFETALAELQTKIGDDKQRQQLFNDLLAATDTRTTEQIANDLLEQIASNTAGTIGAGVDVAGDRKNALAAMNGPIKYNITQFNELSKQIGNVVIPLKVVDTVYKPLEGLAQKLPGVVQDVIKALKKLTTVKAVSDATGGTPLANGGMLPKYFTGGQLNTTIKHSIPSVSGGTLLGPSHLQGGIPTKFGELEGGEFIVNKKSTAKNLPLLESINSTKGTSFDKSNMLGNPFTKPNMLTNTVSTNKTVTQPKEDLNIKNYQSHLNDSYSSDILKSKYQSEVKAITDQTTAEVKPIEVKTQPVVTAKNEKIKQQPTKILQTETKNTNQTHAIDYTKLATTIIDAIKTIKTTNTEWKEFAATVSGPITKALSTPLPVTVTVKNDKQNSDFAMNSNRKYGF